MNRLSGIVGAMFALSALHSMPEISINVVGGDAKPARPASKAEILFDTRQQRRAREREKPIARPKPRGRRRK